MAPQYIYTMVNLRKVVPPQREILKGIYLSFFPGAKIGVLGLNGAGKSSLLRIMAGVDKDFNGEAFPADGTRVGFLAQDPWLDPAKNVLENVEAAVAPIKKLLARFDELGEKMGESLADDEMEKVMAEYGRVQDAIEAANGWDLDRTLETAMDALRCPPPDVRRHEDLRRRAAPRRALPRPPREARPPPPRRADEPPRRRVGRLARAAPRRVPRHRRRRHARPLLPRQRRPVDPRAGPRRRHPVEGELHLLARAEGVAPRAGGEGRDGQAEDARARAGVGADGAARPARQGEGAPPGLRAAPRRQRLRGSRRDERDLHPGRAPPRRRRRPRGEPEEVVRRQPPLRRPLLRPAEGRASSASSARTAPARRPSSR